MVARKDNVPSAVTAQINAATAIAAAFMVIIKMRKFALDIGVL